MSSVFYIASDKPLKERPNPHDKMVSVNEALELGYENIPEFMLKEDFDRNKPDVLLVVPREIPWGKLSGISTGEFQTAWTLSFRRAGGCFITPETAYFADRD